MIIPFVDLKSQYKSIQSEIAVAMGNVLTTTHFIQGEEVKLFETEFANYIGVKQCVTVNSGTDALILGMRALGITKGDEVIVPVNTFIATALGVVENGATPVFVDIDPNDYGMSLDDLKKKITPKTKAIIAVHLYGQPEKIDEILEIIKNSGQQIHLIEDACQSHGSMYKGKRTGSFGIFAAFSFYPGKNLGAYGDGGALVTNDDTLAQNMKMIREYGQEKKYVHTSLGTNSRLDTIQAAVLRVKLPHLDDWNRKRQEAAVLYTSLLKESGLKIKTPAIFDNRLSVYHLYVIEVDARDEVLKYLNDHEVQALIHYPTPLHLQRAFAYLGYKKGDFPTVEASCERILSLPMFPELSKEQGEIVVQTIKDYYGNK